MALGYWGAGCEASLKGPAPTGPLSWLRDDIVTSQPCHPLPVDVEWRRAAAYVLCRDETGRLLLTRFVSLAHPDSGKWTMPGGAMEWGENPEATAIRELEEETGLNATMGPILGVFSRWYTPQESALGQAGHVVGIVFEGKDLAGQLRKDYAEGTTDAARWFTLEEIHRLPRVELVDFVLSLV